MSNIPISFLNQIIGRTLEHGENKVKYSDIKRMFAYFYHQSYAKLFILI